MDPAVVGMLAGGAGALVMLLIVLLGLVGFVAPLVRAVLRFVSNFDNLSARRVGGKIVVSGGLDDWRDSESPAVPMLEPTGNGGSTGSHALTGFEPGGPNVPTTSVRLVP